MLVSIETMKPVIVDSTQCHLWTDALHARALSREAKNKWDRGTYVRFCVTTIWIALETSCQDALCEKNIGYRFKANLDQAVVNKGLEPIDWSQGIWQKIIQVQNTRKDYVHKYMALKEMFPDSDVADNAIEVVREAIKDIYLRSGKEYPEWVDIHEVKGWDKESQFGMATVSQTHLGSSFEDPNTKRIYIVINGEEKLTSVFPSGHDTSKAVAELLQSVNVPIESIRVYDCGELVEDNIVMMRGN